jgi:hypothetical protein
MIPERRKEISSRSQLEHIMEEIKSCPHQKEYPGLDLSDTNLFGIDLSGIDLSGSKLRGATFVCCNMSGMKMKNCDLRDVRICRCSMKGADISGSLISGAYIDICNMDAMNLSASILDCATIVHCSVKGSSLRNCSFMATEFRHCDFTGSLFIGAIFGATLMDKSEDGINNFENCDFTGAYFHVAMMRAAWLKNTCMKKVLADGLDISGSGMWGVRLKGAVLTDLTADYIQPDQDCFKEAEFVGFASQKESSNGDEPGTEGGPVSEDSFATDSKNASAGRTAPGKKAAPVGGAAA